MKISKNSWHYRYNMWNANNRVYKVERHNTLCSYFWHTVWNIVFNLFSALVLWSAFTYIGLGPVDHFTDLEGWGLLVAPMLGTTLIAVLVGIVLGLCVIVEEVTVRVNKRRRDRTPRESGVLVSFIKAKKRKVCPLIDFTDE